MATVQWAAVYLQVATVQWAVVYFQAATVQWAAVYLQVVNVQSIRKTICNTVILYYPNLLGPHGCV